MGWLFGRSVAGFVRIPSRPTIKKLQAAAAVCKACGLWKKATQTVFFDRSKVYVTNVVKHFKSD